jgi:hypothetical protein
VFVKAAALWVVGLVTLVPYGTYYLLFHAPKEQYALLITLVLFWIFGYWGLVGPLLALVKVRTVFRSLEGVRSRDDLMRALHDPDARTLAIDLIASENHIPRFLATRVYRLLVSRLAATAPGSGRTAPDR